MLSHDRRFIRHVAITAHPTAQWTAEQVAAAFPDQRPQILLRDDDAIYGDDFSEAVRALALEELRTSLRSPGMNPYVERVIGTVRKECTDHVIALNERSLERVLREQVERYDNPARPHLSLEANAPLPRTRDPTPAFDIVGEPVLAGLHHRYRRAC